MDSAAAYALLGVEPTASLEEVSAAWRRQAKEWHPDLRGDAQAIGRMVQLNAAYELILAERTGRAPDAGAGTGATPERGGGEARRRPPARGPGWWLDEPLRALLGRELLTALHEREPVRHVTGAQSAGSAALVVVTDRRLLWLLDDLVLGRVRSLPLASVTAVERAPERRWRRSAALRVRAGRARVTFAGLSPEAADRLAAVILPGVGTRRKAEA